MMGLSSCFVYGWRPFWQLIIVPRFLAPLPNTHPKAIQCSNLIDVYLLLTQMSVTPIVHGFIILDPKIN